MTSRPQIDLRQILLEGAEDRLRCLGETDRQEVLLAVHSLYSSASAASLSDLLPLLSSLEDDLIESRPDAVQNVRRSIRASLEQLRRAEAETSEDVLECFADEASQHLSSVRALLERLAARPEDRSAREEVVRALHTLKGAAAMVGATDAARAAHGLEDQLQDSLDQGAKLDGERLDRLAEGLARVEALVAEARSGLMPAADTAAGESRTSPPAADHAAPASQHHERRGETTTVLRLPLAQTSTLLEAARDTRLASGDVARAARATRETGDSLTSIHRELLDLAGRDPTAARLCRVLGRDVTSLTAVADDLERASAGLDRAAGRARRLVTGLRATTAAWIFKRLEVVAEDAGRTLGRRVVVRRRGESVEVDRQMAGWVLDPLLHVVRNAVAHGVEDPAQRVALGKEPSGRITLDAEATGGTISFSVSDDGRGIDVDLLRQRLVTTGVRTAAEAARATREQILDWMFLPRVSIRVAADEVAGRGVGLDAVRSEVARKGGTVSVETWPSRGTRFVIIVPHPAESQHMAVVAVGPHRLAIPLAQVRRTEDATGAGGREVDLAAVLRVAHRDPARRRRVAAEVDGTPLALLVDEVELGVEVSLFPEARRIGTLGLSLGVSADGRALPVLDLAALLPTRTSTVPPPPPRVLLAEDSATTRALLVSTLTAAGFDVVSAVDGLEAWVRLCGEPFDLLVTDLEMPRLDGLELVGRIRAEQHMAGLPVVIVTSSRDDALRARAETLGIEAFVAKDEGDAALADAARRAVRRRREGSP